MFLNIFLISAATILFFLSIYVIIELLNRWKNIKLDRRLKLFDHYEYIYFILDESEKTVYEKIFKTDIIVNSSSGYRLNKEDIEAIQKKYIREIMQCCGDSIINDLIEVHGDLESISIMLLNKFINRIQEDELSILNKVMDDDTDKLTSKEENLNG